MENQSYTEKRQVRDGSSPFIIWTLRRTGGTNLASYLFESSPYAGIEHEPLNIGRSLGYITKGWQDTGDRVKLKDELKAVLERGVLVKHCVETVPEEVTKCLAELSMEMGYKHIFRFRRQSLGRLLSLHFARKIGIWGKNHKDLAEPAQISEELKKTDIPIEELIRRERKDRQALNNVYDLLQAQGMVAATVQFEDIYNRSDRAVSIGILERLIAFLGLPPDDKAVLEAVLFKGDQKTRHHYRDFRNYEEFERAVSALPPCQLGMVPPALSPSALVSKEGSVVKLFAARRSWRSDLLRVEGVGVDPGDPAAVWHARSENHEFETFNGLASQKFGSENPDVEGSSNARFIVLDVPETAVDMMRVELQ